MSAGCGWFEAVDQCVVASLELAIVETRVFTGEGDDLAVILDGLPIVAADLVHQAKAGVTVMDVGEALQQFMGGLLGLVEQSGVDEIEDTVGCGGEFVVAVVAEAKMIWVRFEHLSGEGLALGLLDLGKTAALVFFATAAGAGIIPSDLGHFSGSA